MNLHDCKKMIASGQIKVFNDLFVYVTVAEVARGMKRSPKHIETLRANPLKVTLGDIYNLSEAIGFEGWERVASLFIFD
jgi:hypothetical protein